MLNSVTLALQLINTGANETEPILLEGTEIIVGRGSDCNIRFEAPQVSRRHAKLHNSDGWILTDLDSGNGTFRNDIRIIGEVRIFIDDIIGFGPVKVKVVACPNVTETLQSGAVTVVSPPHPQPPQE